MRYLFYWSGCCSLCLDYRVLMMMIQSLLAKTIFSARVRQNKQNQWKNLFFWRCLWDGQAWALQRAQLDLAVEAGLPIWVPEYLLSKYAGSEWRGGSFVKAKVMMQEKVSGFLSRVSPAWIQGWLHHLPAVPSWTSCLTFQRETKWG